ncbi:hypothetical protein B0H66DRAFT_642895 [Apodospora peruviana]|uniref:Uncharacterized protein n=1 Tax=Apodospora peruviana TaxID=516989 RepID=A0AAE0LZH5_9PEZI|nr:hypothetical protein B0H66DRAFT_642895 [Apodospora peruviana]
MSPQVHSHHPSDSEEESIDVTVRPRPSSPPPPDAGPTSLVVSHSARERSRSRRRSPSPTPGTRPRGLATAALGPRNQASAGAKPPNPSGERHPYSPDRVGVGFNDREYYRPSRTEPSRPFGRTAETDRRREDPYYRHLENGFFNDDYHDRGNQLAPAAYANLTRPLSYYQNPGPSSRYPTYRQSAPGVFLEQPKRPGSLAHATVATGRVTSAQPQSFGKNTPNEPIAPLSKTDAVWSLSSERDVTVHLELEVEDDMEANIQVFTRLRRIGDFKRANQFSKQYFQPTSHIGSPELVEDLSMLLSQGAFNDLSKTVSQVDDDTLARICTDPDETTRAAAIHFLLISHLTSGESDPDLPSSIAAAEIAVRFLTERLRGLEEGLPLGPEDFNILCQYLQLIAVIESDTRLVTDQDIHCLKPRRRWPILYRILLAEDRYWDLHDFIIASLNAVGERDTFQYLFADKSITGALSKLLADWKEMETDDLSDLALLQILGRFSDIPQSESFDVTTERKMSQQYVCQEEMRVVASSIRNHHPELMKSRAYLRWVLFEEKAARNARPNTKSQTSTIADPFDVFPGKVIMCGPAPIYCPVDTENPGWHISYDAESTPNESKALLMTVLKTAQELDDYRTQARCLRELACGSKDPTDYITQLEHLQLTTMGSPLSLLTTRLMRYLVAVDDESREKLKSQLLELDPRLHVWRNFMNPVLEWAYRRVLYALMSSSPQVDKAKAEVVNDQAAAMIPFLPRGFLTSPKQGGIEPPPRRPPSPQRRSRANWETGPYREVSPRERSRERVRYREVSPRERSRERVPGRHELTISGSPQFTPAVVDNWREDERRVKRKRELEKTRQEIAALKEEYGRAMKERREAQKVNDHDGINIDLELARRELEQAKKKEEEERARAQQKAELEYERLVQERQREEKRVEMERVKAQVRLEIKEKMEKEKREEEERRLREAKIAAEATAKARAIFEAERVAERAAAAAKWKEKMAQEEREARIYAEAEAAARAKLRAELESRTRRFREIVMESDSEANFEPREVEDVNSSDEARGGEDVLVEKIVVEKKSYVRRRNYSDSSGSSGGSVRHRGDGRSERVVIAERMDGGRGRRRRRRERDLDSDSDGEERRSRSRSSSEENREDRAKEDRALVADEGDDSEREDKKEKVENADGQLEKEVGKTVGDIEAASHVVSENEWPGDDEKAEVENKESEDTVAQEPQPDEEPHKDAEEEEEEEKEKKQSTPHLEHQAKVEEILDNNDEEVDEGIIVDNASLLNRPDILDEDLYD